MRKVETDKSLEKKYIEFDSEIIPHLNSLKSFALKMTNDTDESEDLIQDTLLKAFRFFDKFEKGTNAKAWLFQIMKNSFINNYRKTTKEPFKVDYDDVQNFYETIKSEDVKTQHYENDAFSDVLDDEIAKALSILPDDFRTVVFLSDIEGYTYEEIADFIDCPVGTVRSRLHRARKMLYALLLQYAQENGYISKKSKVQINARNEKMLNKLLISKSINTELVH
ncbi:MAG: sigma-70 family RNA polymerase sigma factor [Melioribacteraceae bacterium]